MIIKVPIYVEVDKIPGDNLPELVQYLSKVMSIHLLKSKFNSETKEKAATLGVGNPKSLKILSHEEALDSLRTSR